MRALFGEKSAWLALLLGAGLAYGLLFRQPDTFLMQLLARAVAFFGWTWLIGRACVQAKRPLPWRFMVAAGLGLALAFEAWRGLGGVKLLVDALAIVAGLGARLWLNRFLEPS